MINKLLHLIKGKLNIPARVGGLVPQPEDSRDWVLKTPKTSSSITEIDLRDEMPPVTNQGHFASCTAHAINAVVQFILTKKGLSIKDFRVSEAYQWYWHRVMENRFPNNTGVFLRDGFKVIKQYGMVAEQHMPWNTPYDRHPSRGALAAASVAFSFLIPRIGGYYRVNNKDIRAVVLSGKPVIFGLGLDQEFMRINRFNPYYDRWVGSVNYFHAMVIVGLKVVDGREYYIVRNSWGSRWGDEGHCYVSRHFLDNRAFDVWTILEGDEK